MDGWIGGGMGRERSEVAGDQPAGALLGRYPRRPRRCLQPHWWGWVQEERGAPWRDQQFVGPSKSPPITPHTPYEPGPTGSPAQLVLRKGRPVCVVASSVPLGPQEAPLGMEPITITITITIRKHPSHNREEPGISSTTNRGPARGSHDRGGYDLLML